MTNPEIVKAILELLDERGVSGQYFQANTYEKEEYMPHSKTLGGLPIEYVLVSADPIFDVPDGRLEISVCDKTGRTKSRTFDGTEDEDFYNLLDEIYYCTCGPEDPDLEDWLKKKGFEI